MNDAGIQRRRLASLPCDDLISHEMPALFGEFSTTTGFMTNPLSGKDDLWSELIHLGEGILEQLRALEVLSDEAEYTALLEAVRLFDDR